MRNNVADSSCALIGNQVAMADVDTAEVPERHLSTPEESLNPPSECETGGDVEKDAVTSNSSLPPKELKDQATCESGSKENGEVARNNEKTTTIEQKQADPLPMPSAAKVRYDWYQTQGDVVVSIMIKKLRAEDVSVHFTEKAVSVSIKLPSGSEYNLELDLAHSVVPAKCRTKVLSTKVELKMRKCEGLLWSSLEEPAKVVRQPKATESGEDKVHKYPSSSHYTRDWDKLVADVKLEEKEEKPEGDAALNKLFQQIYHDGNDEVRKAMNKSFVESGGTVLSTNWGEVGTSKVDRKPPDGMEWRNYET